MRDRDTRTHGDAPTLLAVCHRAALVREGILSIFRNRWPVTALAGARDLDEYRDISGSVDCAVVESTLPSGGYREVVSLRGARPERPPILVLFSVHELELGVEAVRAGAAGVVALNTRPTDLVAGVEAILRGRRNVHVASADSFHVSMPRPEGLSERERQILRFVAAGFTNREIAEKLSLGRKTVEGYRLRAVRKVGTRTRADVVKFVRRLGYQDPLSDGEGDGCE